MTCSLVTTLDYAVDTLEPDARDPARAVDRRRLPLPSVPPLWRNRA